MGYWIGRLCKQYVPHPAADRCDPCHVSPVLITHNSLDDPTCTNARGGVFAPGSSAHWSEIGTWQLPLNYPGYEANGEYGKDKINAHSSISDIDFPMDNVLVSAINTTDYFNGYFGLGISKANFSDEVEEPPLVQAVKSFGRIPSYTYGYTAGASYRRLFSPSHGRRDANFTSKLTNLRP